MVAETITGDDDGGEPLSVQVGPVAMRRVLGGLLFAALAAACSSSGSTSASPPTSAPPAPLPSGALAATSADILGLWKPTGPHGNSSPAFVLFSADRWSGSDGCNPFNGQYTLTGDGRLTASSGPTTLIGCLNWKGPTWVSEASRIAISGGNKLVLYDKSGKRLGEMVRSVAE